MKIYMVDVNFNNTLQGHPALKEGDRQKKGPSVLVYGLNGKMSLSTFLLDKTKVQRSDWSYGFTAEEQFNWRHFLESNEPKELVKNWYQTNSEIRMPLHENVVILGVSNSEFTKNHIRLFSYSDTIANKIKILDFWREENLGIFEKRVLIQETGEVDYSSVANKPEFDLGGILLDLSISRNII